MSDSDGRIELWACGGGRQSAGIAALIKQERLPKPDHACMVRLEWEADTTWPYVDRYIRPALADAGVPFTVIERTQYATVGLWSNEGKDHLLVPAYSDLSGKMSKLPEFCSDKWKRQVSIRWAAEQPGWKDRGVNVWLGITFEERHRRQGSGTAMDSTRLPALGRAEDARQRVHPRDGASRLARAAKVSLCPLSESVGQRMGGLVAG